MKEVSEKEIQKQPFASTYEVSTELGRGKFAVVKKCRNLNTNQEYAAKFIRKRRMGKDCRKDVLHEIEMLHITFSNSRFVKLLEIYESLHDMILVTEIVQGGELHQYIATDRRVEEPCTRLILRQVLEGLSFLHSQNIAHLDIKPENILLTESPPNCNVKLCDLGLARQIRKNEDLFDLIGTPDYVAPEILDYKPLTVACDMWSVGVLAYVMLTGCSPFAGNSIKETYLNISQVNLDFPEENFSDISKLAIKFIRTLLIKEPGERLKVNQSLDHCWLINNNHSFSTPNFKSQSSIQLKKKNSFESLPAPSSEFDLLITVSSSSVGTSHTPSLQTQDSSPSLDS